MLLSGTSPARGIHAAERYLFLRPDPRVADEDVQAAEFAYGRLNEVVCALRR